MKTLCSSSSMVCSDNPIRRERKAVISISLREILGRKDIIFLSFPNQFGITFSNSIVKKQQKRRNQHVFVSSFSSSSATQEALQDEQTQIQDTSKTVHVKFQLQRKCSFGEHFLLSGDDTMFGSWDPLSAVPLVWSEGDLWTVELDIPVGKVIKYKFILKEITGDVLWQPGQDREIQTWETTKTVSVSEDWENHELRIISEDELVLDNEDFVVASDLEINADNITGAENSMFNKEPFHVPKETKSEENDGSYEGVPVLVPGLTPISNIDTEDESLSECSIYIANDLSSQSEKLKNHIGPEQKPEIETPFPEDSTEMTIHIEEEEEEEHDNMQAIECDSTDQKHLKHMENVFENDIQWGCTTLRKLLNNFGF